MDALTICIVFTQFWTNIMGSIHLLVEWTKKKKKKQDDT